MEETSSGEQELWVFSLTFPSWEDTLESQHENVQQVIHPKAISGAVTGSLGV